MTRKIILISGILFLLFIFIAAEGAYPVALVDGSPIFSKDLQKTEVAAKNFVNASLRSTGIAPIDFLTLKDPKLEAGVRRDALDSLIENKILEEEGPAVAANFENLSETRVRQALRDAGNSANTSRFVYGLDENDFERLILLPQARREVVKEALASSQDFDQWFSQVKRKKKVKILFLPFSWNGEGVQ